MDDKTLEDALNRLLTETARIESHDTSNVVVAQVRQSIDQLRRNIADLRTELRQTELRIILSVAALTLLSGGSLTVLVYLLRR